MAANGRPLLPSGAPSQRPPKRRLPPGLRLLAQAALDPATIQGLQERIRALVPPALAAFTRAFRTAFQVPESVSTIAGLITEQRHRLWIEQYLGQGDGHPQS